MYRTVLCRRSWSSRRLSNRCFHSTPYHRVNIEPTGLIAEISSKSIEFHHLFQQVHDYTALPWLVTIPLTVILLRGIVTPIDYYFALCRRDQRLAAPKLALASAIIEKQTAQRNVAGVGLPDDKAWEIEEWKKAKKDIEQMHPRAKPSFWSVSGDAPSSIPASSVIIGLINTSTLLSLTWKDPEIIDLDVVETWGIPLSAVFIWFAMSNHYWSRYDRGKETTIAPQKSSPSSKISKSKKKANPSWTYAFPFLTGAILSYTPGAVILLALTNSVYTSVERKAIKLLFKIPPAANLYPKATLQTTKHPG